MEIFVNTARPHRGDDKLNGIHRGPIKEREATVHTYSSFWQFDNNVILLRFFYNCVANEKYEPLRDYRRQRANCSHSSKPSTHLRRKKGLLMPSAWEHPSSELYLLIWPLVLELIKRTSRKLSTYVFDAR